MKQIIKRIIACCILVAMLVGTTLTSFAEGWNGDGSSSTVGPGPNSGSGYNKPSYNLAPDDKHQGLRFYVVDDNGTLQTGNGGIEVIDFQYNGYPDNVISVTGSTSTCRIRTSGTVHSVTTKGISELGLDAKNKDDYPVQISMGNKRKNGRQILKLLQQSKGSEPSPAVAIVKNYWSSYYEGFAANGYHLVIENLFTMTLALQKPQTTNSNKNLWCSAYEMGLYLKDNGLSLSKNFHSFATTYGNYFSLTLYTDTAETSVEGIPREHRNDNRTILTWEQISGPHGRGTYGFGTVFFSKEFADPIEIVEDDSDVTAEVEQSNTNIISMAFSDDMPDEIYTAYYASQGKYDIGKSGGIPTTEFLMNEISALNRIGEVFYQKYEATRYYTVNISAKYTYYTTEKYKKKDGSTGTRKKEHTGSVTYTHQIPRTAIYYYVRDYNLYELDSIYVDNNAAPISYDGLDGIDNDSVNILISGVQQPENMEEIDKNTLESKHIDWSMCSDASISKDGKFSSLSAANSWNSSSGKSYAEKAVEYPIAHSDHVEVEGKIYLDSTPQQHTAEDISEACIPSTEEIEKRQITASAESDIMFDLANGLYDTTLYAYYAKICGTDPAYYKGFEWCSNMGSDKSHILEGSITLKDGQNNDWKNNEPIHIISPVVSPITLDAPYPLPDLTAEQKAGMTPDEITAYEAKQLADGTQLATGQENQDCQQLRLDNTYTFYFDPEVHKSILGYKNSHTIDNENPWSGRDDFETDNKYDKYVLEKWVKFPFDVYIDNILFTAGTDILLYEYDPQSGTTTAGYTKTNHLIKTSFYIPPWAEETVGVIHVTVVANNYKNGRDDDPTNRRNLYDDEYVTDYVVSVQTSGWLYDFRVVGTYPATPWLGPQADMSFSDCYASLSTVRDELFNGIYNRTGNTNPAGPDANSSDYYQRYYLDGKVDNTIDREKDTLPLADGVSEIDPTAGSLPLDSNVVFSIKTMANLDEDDRLIIRPSFTWYSMKMDKKISSDDILMYYSEGKQKFIPYDSEREFTVATDFNLHSAELKDSIDKDDLQYKADKQGVSVNKVYNLNKGQFINGTNVITGDTLMLYNTKALEELRRNQQRDPNNLIDILGAGFDAYEITQESKRNGLTESCQTWYGLYGIPSNLYIADKRKLEAMGYTGEDPVWDYAVDHYGIDGTEDIWLPEGYLVLNFNITVVKKDAVAGTEVNWLEYRDGTSDQWQRQGLKKEMKVWTPYSIDKWKELGNGVLLSNKMDDAFYRLPVVSGDIAVISTIKVSSSKQLIKPYLVWTS